MSIMPQDPDSKLDPTPTDASLVRHGFHACQQDAAIQTSRCGTYQRLAGSLRTTTPPPNACVVCLDVHNSTCPFCGRVD